MYYNTHYLSWQNAIERDDDDGIIRNATYLNDNDTSALSNVFYGWTANHVDSNGVIIGGTVALTAGDDNYIVPWRLALKITPETTQRIKLSISGVSIDGTTTALLQELTYIFHCMLKCENKLSITTSLNIDTYPQFTAQQTAFDYADEYQVVRSNFALLNEVQGKPSSSYDGSDATATITLTISGHEQKKIYMTCPFLYQEYEFIQNPFVRNSVKYIPQVLREIDEAQSPQYPMAKLMHVLNYTSAQTSALMARYWKTDLDELPVEYDGTEAFSKSKLVDADNADYEYLNWLSQFNGTQIRENVYAVNPGDATRTKNNSVRVATTTSGTLASSFEAGDTVDGVTLAAGDRILIKNQSTGSQNGIYVVNSSGAPTRASDMPVGTLDISSGYTILVQDGNLNSGTIWRITNASNPTIGTTALTFGIKQISVKAATTVSGTLATSFDSADSIDGFELSTGDLILIKDQSTSSQNGVYVVAASGAPTRVATLSNGTVLSNYLDVFVTEGLTNKYKIFRSISDDATINMDPLVFSEVAKSSYEDDVDAFKR